MNDLTNESRADRAEAVLDAYAKACYFHPCGEPADIALGDLLSDLRHLADRYGIDFDQHNRRGAMHYDAEINGDGFDTGGPPAARRPDRQWPAPW